jgi:hypothetical protein
MAVWIIRLQDLAPVVTLVMVRITEPDVVEQDSQKNTGTTEKGITSEFEGTQM